MLIADLVPRIWVSNEEKKLLFRLNELTLLESLDERDQIIAQNLIRKSLLKKIGFDNPYVVKNEFAKIQTS